MPQLQVIKGGPNPLESLFKGASEGLTQKLEQMHKHKENQRALEGLAPMFKGIGMSDEDIQQITKSGIPVQYAIQAAGQFNKRKMGTEGVEDSQRIFNDMAAILNEGYGGKFVSKVGESRFFGEGRKQRAKFDAMRPKFINAIRKLEQSGHITRETMNEIFKSIPQIGELESTTRGKMEGLASTLGLDASSLYPQKEQGPGFFEAPGKREAAPAKQDTSSFFGKGKVKIRDPKTKQAFYPKTQQDLNDAKKAGWIVENG